VIGYTERYYSTASQNKWSRNSKIVSLTELSQMYEVSIVTQNVLSEYIKNTMTMTAPNPNAFFVTLQHGSQSLGTLKLNTYPEVVPKTCANFTELVRTRYRGTKFHRIIKGFMAQGGDYELGNGRGGKSIYGPNFDDENFDLNHKGRGVLSMANSGRNTNGSQFFICFRAAPHLNGKHVVFGSVDMADKENCLVLDALESVCTSPSDNRPLVDVTVSDCGIISNWGAIDALPNGQPNNNDDQEIDIEEDHEGEDGDEDGGKVIMNSVQENDKIQESESKKMNPLQQRLFNLKMKMNQSRRLNRTEVLSEGARLGSDEGKAAEARRLRGMERKTKKANWKKFSERTGGDASKSYLYETTVKSLAKATKKSERAISNHFEVTDTYNPEGQHRAYERNLKNLRKGTDGTKNTDTYDPLSGNYDDSKSTNTEGARILALELQSRSEKLKKRELEIGGDVDYINKRNKKFNEKIERNYGKYTAEIKQNLERGTAL